jgi:fructan beta-fructosidase
VFFGRKEISGEVEFSDKFTGMHTAPYHISDNGEIRFHAFIDLASVELFVDEGAVTMTDIFFPESGYQILSWYRSDSTVNLKRGDIYRLKSIW